MRQMRTPRVSRRMTSCYYPSCMLSHSALDNYTLLEMLDVFSLCVTAELSIVPTNSSPPVSTEINSPQNASEKSIAPRRSSRGLLAVPKAWVATRIFYLPKWEQFWKNLYVTNKARRRLGSLRPFKSNFRAFVMLISKRGFAFKKSRMCQKVQRLGEGWRNC